MNKVAVYGSLRKGLHNHGCLRNSKQVATGTVEGFGLYSLGSYPALSQHGEHNNTVVEVYEVSEATMHGLDALEGYPSYYNRMVCPITTEDGTTVDAWVYYIQEEITGPLVASGDWKSYYTNRSSYA